MRLWLDAETFSATPIRSGTYRYAADSEVMLLAWAVDDGPVNCWDATAEERPAALVAALREAREVWAHNAQFDRLVLAKALPDCAPPLERWRCTMAQALAHGLPGSLDALCSVLHVPQDKAKLKAGKDLVRLFCTPRPKNMKLRRANRESHPMQWREFIEYATQDIDAMRAVSRRLPRWNYPAQELGLWHLDQRVNDRGFAVDVELANGAIAAIDEEQARLAEWTALATGDEVQAATQRDALLDHIAATFGIVLDDLRGSTVDRLLEGDLPQPLRELLEVRQQASTTSTSKYRALVAAETEGRVRGTLQYCGASRTGRWAGRTFQPQNLPRPSLSQREIEFGVLALKAGVAQLVAPNVMELAASAVRSCIIAPPGKKLVTADLANIEGRVLAWLAGEQWKLDAFRAFDRGDGPDLYRVAFSKSFGVRPEDVTKAQRQVGKVLELALGYEGGVGAFVTFAAAYRIDLEQMARDAWATLPPALLDEAAEFYDWTLAQRKAMPDLSREAFICCDVFKRAWRAGHPATTAFWRALGTALRRVADDKTTVVEVGHLTVRRLGNWTRVVLPSGRSLCYPELRLDDDDRLTYLGVNQYTRRWERISTYAGKLVENVTQAVARDVMASAMPAVESRGFDIVLTVHDEIVTETPNAPEFDEHLLASIMATPPSWAPDLPLAAAGFQGPRYRKD